MGIEAQEPSIAARMLYHLSYGGSTQLFLQNLFIWETCLRPWIIRITWLNYTLIRSCKIPFSIHKRSFWKFVKHRKIQYSTFFNFFSVNIFAEFSLKRSWQTFFILFCCIFQIFWKIFYKIKKLSFMVFYRNLVTWCGWSTALNSLNNCS